MNFLSADKWKRIAGITVIIVIWQTAALIVSNIYIVPSPAGVMRAFVSIAGTSLFYRVILITIFRTAIAFAVSLILAAVTALLIHSSSLFKPVLGPMIIFLRSMPVISIILIALIWFGADIVPVFIGILIMYPVITINILDGINATDNKLIEMAKLYRLGSMRKITDIYIPSSLPFVFNGVSHGIGMGIKGIIAAEVLALPALGIGTLMDNARVYIMTDRLFAWTFTALIIAYIIEITLRAVENRMVFWRGR
ncbi:MAG: ABC transporter permease subunit [bacterium]